MIYLELGWREIYVPKDLNYLAEIMPRLDYLKEKLDRILNDGLKKVFGRKIRWCVMACSWTFVLDRIGSPVAGTTLVNIRFDR